MDNKKGDSNESIIKVLEDVQKDFPGLVLPNMGIINNEEEVIIDGKDYLKDGNIKEE